MCAEENYEGEIDEDEELSEDGANELAGDEDYERAAAEDEENEQFLFQNGIDDMNGFAGYLYVHDVIAMLTCLVSHGVRLPGLLQCIAARGHGEPWWKALEVVDNFALSTGAETLAGSRDSSSSPSSSAADYVYHQNKEDKAWQSSLRKATLRLMHVYALRSREVMQRAAAMNRSTREGMGDESSLISLPISPMRVAGGRAPSPSMPMHMQLQAQIGGQRKQNKGVNISSSADAAYTAQFAWQLEDGREEGHGGIFGARLRRTLCADGRLPDTSVLVVSRPLLLNKYYF